VPGAWTKFSTPHASDPPRRGLHALDVLRALHEPAQEHDAVLGIDVDLSLRHTHAAAQLALDLVRERHVVERLTVTPARVEGSPPVDLPAASGTSVRQPVCSDTRGAATATRFRSRGLAVGL
jgi:hypothetical protein